MEWTDPPDPTPRGRKSQVVVDLEKLRKQPRRWAMIKSGKSQGVRTLAAEISRGKHGAGFEAVSRIRGNGYIGCWARYVGEPTEDADG